MAYLIEENRLLRRQIGVQRLRLTDDDRRRLAVRAYRLGREALRDVATIVTPDTLLRWRDQALISTADGWDITASRSSCVLPHVKSQPSLIVIQQPAVISSAISPGFPPLTP